MKGHRVHHPFPDCPEAIRETGQLIFRRSDVDVNQEEEFQADEWDLLESTGLPTDGEQVAEARAEEIKLLGVPQHLLVALAYHLLHLHHAKLEVLQPIPPIRDVQYLRWSFSLSSGLVLSPGTVVLGGGRSLEPKWLRHHPLTYPPTHPRGP